MAISLRLATSSRFGAVPLPDARLQAFYAQQVDFTQNGVYPQKRYLDLNLDHTLGAFRYGGEAVALGGSGPTVAGNRAELNSWRRLLAGSSGHAEGWALYAERLMEQLGYLDDPADRLGMLDGQRMRAARVVLDIGVHLGKPRPDGNGTWDADFALEFMRRNVNMSDEFVRFEVNRYLGWPGQAPSYKIGQRIWEQLRDEYARRESAAFDIKAFHKKALDIGGVGLDTLKSALLD